MNNRVFTDSVCTLSWINEKSKLGIMRLPENDGSGPSNTIPGNLLTHEDDALKFRFLNLLEATILVNMSVPRRIVHSDWTPASKIYKNPSYGEIASEAFKTLRRIHPHHDRVVFQQTLGSRTVSPEVIGEMLGGDAAAGADAAVSPLLIPSNIFKPIGQKMGRATGHGILGFPPIWTTIELTLFIDGRSEGKVLRHSLFPSMNFYARPSGSMGKARVVSTYNLVGSSYDAVKECDRWFTHGWGTLQDNASGPCEGNPWQYNKDDLTIRPTVSGTRIV
jgi:hypothetical protein